MIVPTIYIYMYMWGFPVAFPSNQWEGMESSCGQPGKKGRSFDV